MANPARERWFAHLATHHRDIRACVARYTPKLLDQFDDHVDKRESRKLEALLNLTWFAAPDVPSIQKVPGFWELCQLLDGTIADLDQVHNLAL